MEESVTLVAELKYSFAASSTRLTESSYGKTKDAFVSLGIAFLGFEGVERRSSLGFCLETVNTSLAR